MSGAAGAFSFLIIRTTRNRIARQIARIRSPRYGLAIIFGVLYFWLVFARPGAVGARPPGVSGIGAGLGTAAGIGLALTVILWWLLGGVNGALAFQPAEVQLLFPAPVPRRGLIIYKVVRSQIVILLNALIWALLMRRWGVTISGPLRFLTAWGLFSVLSLHRLGTALVRTTPVTGARWGALIAGKTLALAGAAGLAAGIVPALVRFRTLGAAAGFRGLGDALAAPPVSWVLAPFRLVVAPLYAASAAQFGRAFGIVAGIVALHLLWVLAMNVEFEEIAASASADLARRKEAFRERRLGGTAVVKPGTAVRNWIRLAPTGTPAVAIVWKNTVALIRTGALRTAIVLAVLLVVVSRLIAAESDTGGNIGLIVPFATLAMMSFIIGPRAVRNDLRQDLLHLASIKSYPLSGAAVVAAEMASPTLLLTGFQLLICLIGYLLLPAPTRAAPGLAFTIAMMVITPIGLLALNGLSIGIQNGFALMFPAWVRLGRDSGGVEAIGQNLLVTIGSLLALLLGLLLPAATFAVTYAVAESTLGLSIIPLAEFAGVAVLVAEVLLLIRVLGGVFERTDPTALA